jgi:histone H3/H4
MAKKAPAKKKGDSYIAKAPIRRLMKKEGADLVAADALDKLIGFLEKTAADATKEAIKITKADKRKRVTAADIRKATR